ncbi:MAG: rhodanese-like domain-containing protein [Thioploca sp.]|nr:rhodanese-like domain-containing protein [Thioploca sp.]
MKNFQDLINDCLPAIKEIFPWDLQKIIDNNNIPILLDIREPYEFDALHIKDSINVPRGILETACDYGYEETVPELVKARDREIIIICRSGNRSVLAAYVMQLMGYQSVKSLKTGIKGWNDYELPLQNSHGEIVNIDKADMILMPKIRLEQLPPQHPKIMPG